ncbi:Na+/H+ antiporter NhaA [Desulfobulbus elongatus]|uniref:Na+/H+ antiporter NhaA n=1 Tax=Desulfobulbus elongatus TaxID=53332 RepID=UPI000485F79A
MKVTPAKTFLPPVQRLADKAFLAFERFIHVEAMSGIVLLVTTIAALALANSPLAADFEQFWHLPLTIGLGDYVFSHSLHFWINDVLMTIFFLVVGMEIRKEMHDGALADVRSASLPFVGAAGGVILPALMYLALNTDATVRHGWAVPTATDIAFAVGILTLLGKAVPSSARIFLLTLAIIDDIVAVLIIALFYSGGLDVSGFFIAGGGILAVFFLQWIGVGSAWAYILPGVLLWYGLLKTGAHPTLAGVVLGLITPTRQVRKSAPPPELASEAIIDYVEKKNGSHDLAVLMRPVKRLRYAQRELLPPVVRIQMILHPWVAFMVMPLFAFANAGVSFGDVHLSGGGPVTVFLGVSLGLVFGKPIGVFALSWLSVRMGWCSLPAGMTWSWGVLVGLLAGIGFTMSMFIANLAFTDQELLNASKVGILLGTVMAGIVGLVYGRLLIAHRKKKGGQRGEETCCS